MNWGELKGKGWTKVIFQILFELCLHDLFQGDAWRRRSTLYKQVEQFKEQKDALHCPDQNKGT
jgi:hypothetical protein